jgi:hypothetical protein
LAQDTGGIVGVVEVVDVVESHPWPSFAGPYGFVLEEPRPLVFHPLRGREGVWETGLELDDLLEA